MPQEIFLIHHGKHDYLQIAARCTQAAGNDVILIGNDSATGRLCSAYYDDALIDLPDYHAFEMQYVHLSSAPIEFELLCFKRYFYLYAIASQRGLNHFWMIDSDAIVLQNLSEITKNFLLPKQFCAGVSTKTQNQFDWASSPHTSFWTLVGLESFLSFLKNLHSSTMRDLLNQKYQWHLANSIPGGVCDMTALFLWQKNRQDICNLATIHMEGLPLFDNNLNEDGNIMREEFSMVKNVRLKKIIRKDKIFMAVTQNGSKKVPVLALHFQGRAKGCMSTFERARKITYLTYAPYALSQYVKKRINSLKRKIKNLIP